MDENEIMMPFSPWSMRPRPRTSNGISFDFRPHWPVEQKHDHKHAKEQKKDTSQVHRLITHQIRTMQRQHSHVHTKQRGVVDVWLVCIEGNTLHIEETEGSTYAQNIQHIDQTQIKFASHKCTLSRVTNVAKVCLVGLGGTRCLVCVWCSWCVCVRPSTITMCLCSVCLPWPNFHIQYNWSETSP